MEQKRTGPSEKQLAYINALKSRKYKFLLYGGGIGGGKTFLTLGILDELCQQYPKVRFAIVRKSLSVIRRNTLPSFFKLLDTYGDPKRAWLNKSEWTIKYSNGSEILLVEANIETDPEFNKLKGLEVTSFLMEEANECHEDVFNIMLTRWGRWYNQEYDIPPFALLTCNPDQNWVKHRFYTPWRQGELNAPWYFQPALPHDNPYNSKEFLESLEYLPAPLYKRYVLGDWDYSDDPSQLIPFQFLKKVMYEANPKDFIRPKYLGVDVAREGNDHSALAFFDSSRLLRVEKHKFDKLHKLTDLIKTRIAEYDLEGYNIIVDAIGLGGGVIDLLDQEGIAVEKFKSSESPSGISITGLDSFIFKNKRAEAHWLLREAVYNENIEILEHPDIIKELPVLRYESPDKYLVIEEKKMTKKRLGYSPDIAEAIIMGNYLRVIREGFSFRGLSKEHDKGMPDTYTNQVLFNMNNDFAKTNTYTYMRY